MPVRRNRHSTERHLRTLLDDEDARSVLAEFLRDEAPAFIPCDRRALDSTAIISPRKTPDIYLDLASARGWHLATLDEGIAHPSADLIPELLVEP